MGRESLFAERDRLIDLGQQAKGGDDAAVDELLTYALRLLVEEYNRNLPKGRPKDKQKIETTVYWATRAATLQLETTGKITKRELTTDTVDLAEPHKVYLARRTTFDTINDNLHRITRDAAFAARPVKDSFKENIKAIISESDKELIDFLLNGRN